MLVAIVRQSDEGGTGELLCAGTTIILPVYSVMIIIIDYRLSV